MWHFKAVSVGVDLRIKNMFHISTRKSIVNPEQYEILILLSVFGDMCILRWILGLYSGILKESSRVIFTLV